MLDVYLLTKVVWIYSSSSWQENILAYFWIWNCSFEDQNGVLLHSPPAAAEIKDKSVRVLNNRHTPQVLKPSLIFHQLCTFPKTSPFKLFSRLQSCVNYTVKTSSFTSLFWESSPVNSRMTLKTWNSSVPKPMRTQSVICHAIFFPPIYVNVPFEICV